jgi:hypothetical protein
VSGLSFRTGAIASPGSLKGTHRNKHNIPRKDAVGVAREVRACGGKVRGSSIFGLG